MVYRAAIDETRRPWRRERAAGDAMPDVAQRDPAGAIDERQRIRAALHAVPPRQRAAVILRWHRPRTRSLRSTKTAGPRTTNRTRTSRPATARKRRRAVRTPPSTPT